MKQLLQNFKTGELSVTEIPPPALRDGFVLVRNHYSLISPGTEGSTVKLGQSSLLGKAKARPELVQKVVRSVQTEGLLTTYQFVRNSLELPNPLGYCCSGEVLAAGSGVKGVRVGDHVACGGGGHAVHAEIVAIPKNLCIPVSQDLDLRFAAFTTLGSIAMQSVRVAEVQLGENVVVIGLGLVGLLCCELLRVSGCHVFGIDLSPARVRFAIEKGYCEDGLPRGDDSLAERVAAFTGGRGADLSVIAAATPNNDPVDLSGQLARHKGRVVVVGRTVMEAPRDTYLFKELELKTSLAYGPGTGDPEYEEEGIDYPYPYVRWTEGRNMASFARLAAEKRIQLEPLISEETSIEDSPSAFDRIVGKASSDLLGILLRYDTGEQPPAESSVAIQASSATSSSTKLRIGVIGAGSFATNVFLPTLSRQQGVELEVIASAKGIRARSLGEKYGFSTCTSDAHELLTRAELDCVFILTRHDTHAEYAALALENGKAVFVEKPLALDEPTLQRVQSAHQNSGKPVMVGFNRRFASMAKEMKAFFGDRSQPLAIDYRANVGYRPPENWLHHPTQGGGVILAEGSHFIDFCHWLTEAELTSISATKIHDASRSMIAEDNAHLQLSFADGSIASVRYLSNGSPSFSRERIEVLGENRTATLDDFRHLAMARGSRRIRNKRSLIKPDKGFDAQVRAFLESVRSGSPLPHQDLYFASSATSIQAASLVFGSNSG